jgi:hypothetical protein
MGPITARVRLRAVGPLSGLASSGGVDLSSAPFAELFPVLRQSGAVAAHVSRRRPVCGAQHLPQRLQSACEPLSQRSLTVLLGTAARAAGRREHSRVAARAGSATGVHHRSGEADPRRARCDTTDGSRAAPPQAGRAHFQHYASCR